MINDTVRHPRLAFVAHCAWRWTGALVLDIVRVVRR